MKLIKPYFEIIEQESGLEGIYKQIELAGRTCYKSEDKITPDSAKGFVDRMIKSGHGAMLEHGTVYLKADSEFYNPFIQPEDGEEEEYNDLFKYGDNNYSVCHEQRSVDGNTIYVTTNLRVLVENNWLDDLKYLCEPTEYHEKRITVKFICDRGVSHELVRHRVFSFAQESTRYCNYSKDKFGKELTFIIPCWLDIPEGQSYWYDGLGYRVGADIQNQNFGYIKRSSNYGNFLNALENDENVYLRLLNEGWTPQQARSVLPNALKTELVMTGTLEQWKGFFKLRSPLYGAIGAHPQAAELADKLYIQFKEKNYI